MQLIGRKNGSVCIFPSQSRIGQQPASQHDALQAGKLLVHLPDIFHRQQVTVIHQRMGALLIESGERSQVHLSLVLLLPDTRMQNDPPQGGSVQQRQQRPPFIRTLPSQSHLDGETQFRIVHQLFQ